MCIVSAVTTAGQKAWPLPDHTPYLSNQTKPWDTVTVPYSGPTKQEWEQFKEMIRKALELDKYTKQPDCIDPEKEAWLKAMEEIYDVKNT